MKTKLKIANDCCGAEEQSADCNAVMTVTEAAHYLRKSEAAIYTMISRKELPYIKLGRCVRFFRKNLDEYLASKAVPTRRRN